MPKRNETARPWLMTAVFSVVFLLAIALVASESFLDTENQWTAIRQEIQIVTDWSVLEDGKWRPVDDSTSARNVTVDRPLVLSAALPQYLQKDCYAMIDDSYHDVEMWVGEERVIERLDAAHPSRESAIWRFVPLEEEWAGQTVTVNVFKKAVQKDSVAHELYVGTKSDIVLHLLLQRLDIIVFTAIMLVLTICFAIMSAVGKKQSTQVAISFVHLCMMSLLAGVWVLTDSRLPYLFLPPSNALMYISFFSFMLFPVPILLFIAQLCKTCRTLLQCCCLAMLAAFLASAVLQALGVVTLSKTLPIVHVVLIISIVCLVFSVVKEWRREKNQSMRFVAIGLMIFSFFAIGALVEFYVGKQRDNSLLFRLGFVAFAIMLGAEAISKSLAVMSSNQEINIYKRLAYVDALTRLANRAEFDRDQARLSHGECQPVGMILMDINGLKSINDTYGHAEGDDVIQGFGHCVGTVVKQFFPKGQAYRVGGDEFAITLPQCLEEDALRCVELIEEALMAKNQSRAVKIGFAYGCSIKKTDGKDPDWWRGLFNESDKGMYEHKIAQKTDEWT